VFRLIRFSAVGIAVSILYTGLVVAAIDLLSFRSPSFASAAAFLLVQPVSFYAHRFVSFHDAQRDGRQLYRFSATAITSFTLAVGGMKVVTEVWELSYLFGIALTWLLIPSTNFLVNSLWVFPLRSKPADDAPGEK
jgi:putative flippase GtrA